MTCGRAIMKIIDNKKDFYDYYQNIYRDDSLVFDRRKSFIFKKQTFARLFENDNYKSKHKNVFGDDHDIKYFLMQICNTFWFFTVHITKYNNLGYGDDYDLKLVCTWKDYSKPRKLISLGIIEYYRLSFIFSKNKKPIEEEVERIKEIVRTDDYHHYRDITEYGGLCTWHYDGIPILQDIGIAGCVDHLDVYLSFEEYFALEKASIEDRRDSIGLTNTDKIENHGFDKKISFRGK